jgi:hypothetical protein
MNHNFFFRISILKPPKREDRLDSDSAQLQDAVKAFHKDRNISYRKAPSPAPLTSVLSPATRPPLPMRPQHHGGGLPPLREPPPPAPISILRPTRPPPYHQHTASYPPPATTSSTAAGQCPVPMSMIGGAFMVPTCSFAMPALGFGMPPPQVPLSAYSQPMSSPPPPPPPVWTFFG